MKHLASLLLFAALFTSVWAQTTTVHGKLKGFTNPTLYVFEVNHDQLIPIDSIAPNKKGEFAMKLHPEKPTLYVVQINLQTSNSIHLMVMPKEKIQLDLELLNPGSFIRISNTKGSKNMETYMAFNHALSDSLNIIMTINNEYQVSGVTDQRKMELGNHYQNIMTQQNLRIRHLLEQHTDCLISAFLVTYFDKDFTTYAPLYEAVHDVLKKDYPDNSFVQYLGAKIAASLTSGSMAPEIDMKDPNDNSRKLSDLKGKVVLVDFWASWCSPCRKENPNVVKLYHKYNKAGFEIYSVSLDKRRDDWVRAIQSDGLLWPNHVSDLQGWTSSGGAAYGITSVPSTVLIDREGRIIAKNLRGPDLERKLTEIFGF